MNWVTKALCSQFFLLNNQTIYDLKKDDFIQRFKDEQYPTEEEEVEELIKLSSFSFPNTIGNYPIEIEVSRRSCLQKNWDTILIKLLHVVLMPYKSKYGKIL